MTDRWSQKINATTANFKNEFSRLTVDELNWKPNPQTWSIAQNIDHLIVINATYYPVIDAIRKGSYKVSGLAKLGFMVNFLGKMILGSVQPDRKRKMKTFPIWEPSTSAISGDILQQFEKHQDDLKKLILNCGDLIDKNTIIASPANKNIVYKLETAFDIIVTHEERHFAQAKEVGEMRKSKS
jgi:hypothetical protein